METWSKSDILYDGAIVRLRVGEVTLDNGRAAKREVIEHPGGVCVVPYTGDSVVLVRQFRIAVNEYVLELPAGKLEQDDTDSEYRGRCELEEEAGYTAGRMVYVGYIYSAIGFCSEKVHIYLALDLTKTQQKLEEEERIEIVEVPLEEVRQGLKKHQFLDSKTAVGLQALLYHLDG
jgi:ADP-ribose pyrophosphatase